MENSGVQSQRSMSSIGTSNQILDSHCGPSSANATEFVNHGLLRWMQIRQEWLKNSKTEKQQLQVREPRLSWNATYDSLLGTNKPFPQPVPLRDNFLLDKHGLHEFL